MRHRLSPGACAPLLAWIALTLWGSGAAAQEGYRLLWDRILVDTETHWQASASLPTLASASRLNNSRSPTL